MCVLCWPQVMRSELAEEPACLFVVGSYHIGKERAYLGAAQALGCKVRLSGSQPDIAARQGMAVAMLLLRQASLLSVRPHVSSLVVR